MARARHDGRSWLAPVVVGREAHGVQRGLGPAGSFGSGTTTTGADSQSGSDLALQHGCQGQGAVSVLQDQPADAVSTERVLDDRQRVLRGHDARMPGKVPEAAGIRGHHAIAGGRQSRGARRRRGSYPGSRASFARSSRVETTPMTTHHAHRHDREHPGRAHRIPAGPASGDRAHDTTDAQQRQQVGIRDECHRRVQERAVGHVDREQQAARQEQRRGVDEPRTPGQVAAPPPRPEERGTGPGRGAAPGSRTGPAR